MSDEEKTGARRASIVFKGPEKTAEDVMDLVAQVAQYVKQNHPGWALDSFNSYDYGD